MKPAGMFIGVLFIALFCFLSIAGLSQADTSGRDPFAFGSIQNARLESDLLFGLQAVIISGKIKIALINGRRYRVGDNVAGTTITNIALTHVVTTKNGMATTHRLGGAGE